MKTVLFLHGFFASGSCVPATALKEALEGQVRVLTPDLPTHPKEALGYIHQICDKESPDLLVGNSCGSFYAQILAPIVGIPALLGNPHFKMTEFLKERIGSHEYKSPRADGKQDFEITEELIREFEEVEQMQFNYTNPYYKDKVWGIFGLEDTLACFESTFLEHYNNRQYFPGAHTPTADEVKTWYVPIIELMLNAYPKPKIRYFQHFRGGKYKFIRTAFDSETQERMVVYQALYGEQEYWVRPEKMFFEKVTRDGRMFNRFTEMKKVYFAGSIRGGRIDAKLYERLIKYIQRTDFVLTEHIGCSNLNLMEQGKKDEDIYNQDMAWLRESDVLIGECTCPSLGVGYELAYAEKCGKECHIFYDKTKTQLSAMLTGNPYFNIHPYESEEEIYPIIDSILK